MDDRVGQGQGTDAMDEAIRKSAASLRRWLEHNDLWSSSGEWEGDNAVYDILLAVGYRPAVLEGAGGWRCECGDWNRPGESFCYRCGAGRLVKPADGPGTDGQTHGLVTLLRHIIQTVHEAHHGEFGGKWNEDCPKYLCRDVRAALVAHDASAGGES